METLVENSTFLLLKGNDEVFLNGEWIGISVDLLSFVWALRSKQHNNEVLLQVEWKWDKQQREVLIFSDAGIILATPFGCRESKEDQTLQNKLRYTVPSREGNDKACLR